MPKIFAVQHAVQSGDKLARRRKFDQRIFPPSPVCCTVSGRNEAAFRACRSPDLFRCWIIIPGGLKAGGTKPRQVQKAHERARASDARQAFLLKLSDTLRPLGDALEVQTAALRVLGENLAVNRAFFNEVDEDHDAYVIHRTYVHGVAPLTGHFRLSDVRRTAELAGFGQIVVIDDASANPRLSEVERASYAAMEVAAGIGVSLIKDGR